MSSLSPKVTLPYSVSVQSSKQQTPQGNSGILPKAFHTHKFDSNTNINNVDIPFPQDQQGIQLLLAKYLSYNNEDITPEKLAIERILYDISSKQQVINVLQEELNDKIIENKIDNDVDLELLKKQIFGLQLLSFDYNLPESLQEDFIDDEEQDMIINKDDDDYQEFPIIMNCDDYESQATRLGVSAKPSLKTTADGVGNYIVENILTKKIADRISKLEKIPATLGSYDTSSLKNLSLASKELPEGIDELKLKAIVELKSLRLLPRQKQYRRKIMESVFQRAHLDVDYLKNNPLTMSAQRTLHLVPKIFAPQTARLAEQLEEQQKKEEKKRQHIANLNKINTIVENANETISARNESWNKRMNLGRSLHFLHQKIEKDESRKLESTAKDRLRALKANDEEAYLKLLDQTKDTRITHLLKQTNTFLDSLAQAVKVQQNEAKLLENKVDEVDQNDSDDEDNNEGKIDYYEVAHQIKEVVTRQPKLLVGGTLKEYQLKGLEWMVSLYNNHLNGILADEMGLGKTIQSISLIAYLIEAKKEKDKFLVIVPLSTITNWTLEFEKWAPGINLIVYKGPPMVRKQLQHQIRMGNFKVLLTTYEYIIRDRPLLSKFRWAHMIIDEGHRMKNSQSKLSYTLTNYYHTKNRLILTGTPLQNNLPELWALLNFALPKIFNSVKSFDEWFNTPFANTGSQDKIELTEEESLLIIRRLHKVLRPFLLRRLKKDVEKDLPDKVEKVVKCKLSGLQSVLYQQMLKHNALFVGIGANGATKSGIKGLNNKVMQLRKICNHPFVFEEVENVINPSRLSNDLIYRSSGKFELLDRILPKFKASGHRVLIFFQMTQVMDIMEDYLRYRNLKYLRLDGSTKADDRQTMLKEFNDKDSEYFAFLLSTRAGGLGLNLQTADTVIIFDTDWNPHQDLQAQDRAHRIGQKNEVRILRLITNDSVEEVILERAHQKLDIDGKVIQAGKFDNKSTAQEQEEFLRKLIEAEQQKRNDPEEDDELEDEALNEILARNEDEKILFEKMDTERMATANMESRKRGLSKAAPRLMTEDELPKIFTKDISAHLVQPTKELGRTRERKKVYYDDGLTEEQWLEAMDNDDDSVEAAMQRKMERMAKRRARREKKEDGVSNGHKDTENDSNIVGDDSEADSEGTPGRGRRARRRSRSASVKAEELPTPKRSRRSLSKSVKVEEDEEEEEEDESVDESFIENGLKLLNEAKNLKDESDGHKIAEFFIDLPSKKLYPDYYQFISHPVCISGMIKNLNKKHYKNVNTFKDDLKQLVTNAKTYNEEGSFVYNEAEEIEKFFNHRMQELGL